MANARTAVVVKKSPTAAVAVNSETFILSKIYRDTRYFFWLKLYKIILSGLILIFVLFSKLFEIKKRPHICEAGWWGTLFLNQFK